MFEAIGEQEIALTLYTDAYVVHGRVATRQRRITDILNHADQDFVVIADATFAEFGSHDSVIHSEFAQVNLGAVLFVVAGELIEPLPELRTRKIAEHALITVPPFKITGRIHLLPERGLRDALGELTGRFVPVTDAMYWSDLVGEARTTAALVAFNHARAQILAPHHDVDPWEGLDRHAASAAGSAPAPAPASAQPSDPTDPASPEFPPVDRDDSLGGHPEDPAGDGPDDAPHWSDVPDS